MILVRYVSTPTGLNLQPFGLRMSLFPTSPTQYFSLRTDLGELHSLLQLHHLFSPHTHCELVRTLVCTRHDKGQTSQSQLFRVNLQRSALVKNSPIKGRSGDFPMNNVDRDSHDPMALVSEFVGNCTTVSVPLNRGWMATPFSRVICPFSFKTVGMPYIVLVFFVELVLSDSAK